MYLQQFFIDGLGCASYLVGCEAKGVAAVIDPDREVGKYLAAAAQKGLKITHIIETHLHADHVSGNIDLAARTGADIYVHEAAQAQFPHKTLVDGDVLELGAVRISARHTPGHTPESLTLLVSDSTRSEEPWLAFTGDLLFVGDVGRPDLVGRDAARSLAGDLYSSLHENILQLHDGVLIYPGHGAGSLCGRSIGSMRATTLGYERQSNPSLAITDKERFVEFMTTNLPEQPGNHQRIKALNRKGPQPLKDVQARPLTVPEAIPYFRQGAALLDARSKEQYVTSHVPGAVHLPADDQLSNRVGFVLHPDYPIVLLLEDEQDYTRVVLSLARVGFDNVVGYLAEGMAGWEASGLPTTSGDIQDVSPRELNELLNGEEKPVVVDVREPWEYNMGHISGARLMPLGQLANQVDELDPQQPVAVVCASGSRSQSAAALLGQKGFAVVYNLVGGMDEWHRAGLEMEQSGSGARMRSY
jgi:hydroxyacylglutathione hydrolase